MKLFQKLILSSLLICFMVGCSDSSDGSSSGELMAAANKQDSKVKVINESEKINELEMKIFELVNQYRINHELLPLVLNEEVSRIAREHSENMANGNATWGHNGYSERAELVSSVIEWEELGENLAKNNFSLPAMKAIEEWASSHLHEENMVGSFNISGIGVAISPEGEYFFTQIFVRD